MGATQQEQLKTLEDCTRWLGRFAESKGRPLRVLHVGNIANNAYINAKLQRKQGIESDVMSYDYMHIMSTPEWEEFDSLTYTGDQVHPRFTRATWGNRFPRWFCQGPFLLCAKYFIAKNKGQKIRAYCYHQLIMDYRTTGHLTALVEKVAKSYERLIRLKAYILSRGMGLIRRVLALFQRALIKLAKRGVRGVRRLAHTKAVTRFASRWIQQRAAPSIRRALIRAEVLLNRLKQGLQRAPMGLEKKEDGQFFVELFSQVFPLQRRQAHKRRCDPIPIPVGCLGVLV